MRAPGIEPEQKAWKAHLTGVNAIQTNHTFLSVNAEIVDKYFSIREINGISKNWLDNIKRWIKEYIKEMNYNISEVKTLEYIKQLKQNNSINRYRKKVYQIRRFLEYLNIDWIKHIIPPQEPRKIPKRITDNDIDVTINYFKEHEYGLQCRAVINLGKDSGIRAEEIYQLNLEDIDLENRTVYINHIPEKGQTTKNSMSRVSFFTDKTKNVLKEYIDYFNNRCYLKKLFSETHIERLFSHAPIRVKDLRKYFSAEFTRRNGNHFVKERLMGHSIKDVDSQHYCYLTNEELKKVYDEVMNS